MSNYKYILKGVFLLFLYSWISVVSAQGDPFAIAKYTFINFEENKLEIYDTVNYNRLFNKFNGVGLRGNEKISIVHIGDSHIQADFLSGNFRRKLHTFFHGSVGGRGLIFPYKMAKTNNPRSYTVKSVGKWESCKNVEKNLKCDLGLSGIAVTTQTVTSSFTIGINDPNLKGYDFDQLMVFHDFSKSSFIPTIKDNHFLVKAESFPDKGYTLFKFSKSLQWVTILFEKKNNEQNHFTLYGLNFDSSDPGIIYHTVGVNGAQFESYLKCKHFTSHLSALNADWVILSLGTNDVYTNVFDKNKFKENAENLIYNIKKVAPNAAILLTTPGDHRMHKVNANLNVKVASKVLKQIAQQQNLSYWDFNTVMGGLGSVDAWHDAGLAHTDYLHYTKKGYVYQSQLLFNAFLKAYGMHIDKILNLESN